MLMLRFISTSGSGEEAVMGDQVIMDNNVDTLTIQIPSPTKKSPKISPKYPMSPTKGGNKKKSRATSTAGTQKSSRVYHAGMRTVYTSGRPPWYNAHGELKDAFVIGWYQFRTVLLYKVLFSIILYKWT